MPSRLNIPFKTVPKIKKMCNAYSNLVKVEKSKNPEDGSIRSSAVNHSMLKSHISKPDMSKFLNLADEVLKDLKKANDPNNSFIRRGMRKKNFLKNKEDRIPVSEDGNIEDKEFLNDLA